MHLRDADCKGLINIQVEPREALTWYMRLSACTGACFGGSVRRIGAWTGNRFVHLASYASSNKRLPRVKVRGSCEAAVQLDNYSRPEQSKIGFWIYTTSYICFQLSRVSLPSIRYGH